jgi:hypothetical protein
MISSTFFASSVFPSVVTAARFDFLDVALGFFVDLIHRGDKHAGSLRVDERNRPMLHFGGGITFGVHFLPLHWIMQFMVGWSFHEF